MLSTASFPDHVTNNTLAVVKFGAPWCGPCKAMAPLLDKMVEEFPGVSFAEVNVDDHPMLASQYNVRSLPTLMAWKDGQLQWVKIGLPQGAVLRQELGALLS